MICNKCNHKLPDDSAFCQYCGSKIEQNSVEPTGVSTADSADIHDPVISVVAPEVSNVNIPDDAPDSSLDSQTQQTIEVMNATTHTQPDKEDRADIDLDPEESSTTITTPQKTPRISPKYCSKCGSAIDSITKRCPGCGKQYFRGVKLTKFSFTVIALALVIAILSTLCILQYSNAKKRNISTQLEIERLESQVSELKGQIKSRDLTIKNRDSIIETKNTTIKTQDSTIRSRESTIKELQQKVSTLQEEAWDNLLKLSFFDSYVEIIGNDGTNLYHKYDCEKLDLSEGFWILNPEAAESRGYKKCSTCH